MKGVNILINKCEILKGDTKEVNEILESETHVLFKLAHHSVFRIQIQTLKLLFQFARSKGKNKASEFQIDKTEATEESELNHKASFTDRYYRALYELL